ncbi:MAG TPA: 2-dehydro-3-deoxy-6-phosphogalactonate aldolase [Dongiaceae bacterium]
MLRELLQELPLIAILRGIRPEEMPAAADALMTAGFRILEVPLNSPRPLESIRYLAGREGLLSGAGTVLTTADVEAVAAAGGRLVVAPNADAEVIAAAKRLRLTALPGVATPTEAFAALKAGADGLKMFPAELMPPKAIKAWRAVLPAGTLLLPVGGINPETMADYLSAGADGFGLGSALYKPGMPASELGERARAFVAAYRALRPR